MSNIATNNQAKVGLTDSRAYPLFSSQQMLDGKPYCKAHMVPKNTLGTTTMPLVRGKTNGRPKLL